MKTLQEQYNLIKEGQGRKDLFMKQALRQFPQYVTKFNTFEETTSILKGKQILSEGIGGVTTGRPNPFANWDKFLSEEVKAEEKSVSKEVTDIQDHQFDYKDEKNIDNLYGQSFLQGYYTEMKDPSNKDKTVDELKEMVAKNLAKDKTYYTTEAQFGVKGIGYTEDAPGLGPTKEVKGKYASSGMEEVKLKEGKMVKLTDLINESLGGYMDIRPMGLGEEKKEEAKPKKAPKKPKKETVDSKLSEIEKAGKITTLEAQIEALEEAIETKNHRISMVSEDENLSELVDKKKMKDMQREVKDLEKRKVKMEKLYEKMCGKKYVRQEMVDETMDEADEMDY